MGLLWRLNKEVHYSKTAHTKEVGWGVECPHLHLFGRHAGMKGTRVNETVLCFLGLSVSAIVE